LNSSALMPYRDRVVGLVASEDALTHEAGEGPLRAKGNIYVGTHRYYSKAVPGGVSAVLSRLSNQKLIAFLGRPFVASSWYDVGPLVPFGEAAAQVAGVPHLEFLRSQARAQAMTDIHGVYKLLLKLASPEMVMSRLPRVATQYFDFVTAEVRELAPRHWESTGRGIPHVAASTYMATTEAFLVRGLALSGAKNVKHRWFPAESAGTLQGIAVVSLRRELSWG
jgi:hypothetical protein